MVDLVTALLADHAERHFVVRRSTVPVYTAWRITDETIIVKLRGCGYDKVQLGFWFVQDTKDNLVLIASDVFERTYMPYPPGQLDQTWRPVDLDRMQSTADAAYIPPRVISKFAFIWQAIPIVLGFVLFRAVFGVTDHMSITDNFILAAKLYGIMMGLAIILVVITLTVHVAMHGKPPKFVTFLAGVACGVIEGLTFKLIKFN